MNPISQTEARRLLGSLAPGEDAERALSNAGLSNLELSSNSSIESSTSSQIKPSLNDKRPATKLKKSDVNNLFKAILR